MYKDDIYVGPTEFAKRWNEKYPKETITKQYVSKLKIDGIFSSEGSKIAFKDSMDILRERKDNEERASQREANNRKKEEDRTNIFSRDMLPKDSLATASEEEKEEFWKGSTPENNDGEIVDDESLSNSEIFTNSNQNELKQLLKGAKSSNQKVQITNVFWTGKLNRLKALEAERSLIPVTDAKQAIETLLSPLNYYLDDQANNIKNHFPDIPDEVIDWLAEENNRQKEQLRNYDWEL